MANCIDLTGPNTIARRTLDEMSDNKKSALEKTIGSTLLTKLNKSVRDAILDEAHCELLAKLNCEHRAKNVVPVSAMQHPLKPTMENLLGTAHALKVGDWVEVLYTYSPGLCSDGGIGEIYEIKYGEDGKARCNVSYIIDRRIELDIDPSRLTVTIMPYKDNTSSKRVKRAVSTVEVELVESRTYSVPVKTPLEWLKSGLSSRTHEKPGWLKEKLLHHNLIEGNLESLWKRIISDYKCQLSAIEGMQFTMGSEYKDPRETRGVQGAGGIFVSSKKESQLNVPKNMWTIPYLLHAYDVKRSTFRDKVAMDKKGISTLTGIKRKQYNKGQCVITNRGLSRRKYSDKYFFARMKALPGTIPIYKTAAKNDDPTAVHRQPEWRQYPTRVQSIQTCSILQKIT